MLVVVGLGSYSVGVRNDGNVSIMSMWRLLLRLGVKPIHGKGLVSRTWSITRRFLYTFQYLLVMHGSSLDIESILLIMERYF